MILAGYKNAVVARTANCRASSVRRIRANMRCYGSTKAPPNGIGRRRFLSPPMLTALLDRLAVKPNMYRDKMVEFLEKEFETTIPASNIGRSLRSVRWSRKTARRVAKGRNADLRDYYPYKLDTEKHRGVAMVRFKQHDIETVLRDELNPLLQQCIAEESGDATLVVFISKQSDNGRSSASFHGFQGTPASIIDEIMYHIEIIERNIGVIVLEQESKEEW
ncbi:transposase [Fusarium heterosporum]|uniref:Transposase n=1 Tax=Fusarium heterosporum TaxID=42747 RepID=A0A8H5SWD7_FUSHE|nr:transposase [Fusarium heterosporum]